MWYGTTYKRQNIAERKMAVIMIRAITMHIQFFALWYSTQLQRLIIKKVLDYTIWFGCVSESSTSRDKLISVWWEWMFLAWVVIVNYILLWRHMLLNANLSLGTGLQIHNTGVVKFLHLFSVRLPCFVFLLNHPEPPCHAQNTEQARLPQTI